MLIYQTYKSSSDKYFKVITCWVGFEMDIVVIAIYIILIVAISFYCIKSIRYLTGYKNRIKEDDKEFFSHTEEQNENNIKSVKSVQKRLIVYPIITIFLFTLVIIEKLLSSKVKQDANNKNNLIEMICYILCTIGSIFRGIIFDSVYIFSQEEFKQACIDIFCRRKKSNEYIDNISITSLTSIPNK